MNINLPHEDEHISKENSKCINKQNSSSCSLCFFWVLGFFSFYISPPSPPPFSPSPPFSFFARIEDLTIKKKRHYIITQVQDSHIRSNKIIHMYVREDTVVVQARSTKTESQTGKNKFIF